MVDDFDGGYGGNILIIIDPPTPFSPAEEWRDFLKELKSLEPRTPEEARVIAEHIELAERTLFDLG